MRSITIILAFLMTLSTQANAEKLIYACDGQSSIFSDKTDSLHTEQHNRKPFVLEVNDWTIIEYKNYMGDPAKKVYLGEFNPWELIFFDGPGKGIGLVGIQKSGGSPLSDINEQGIKLQEILISVEHTPFSTCYLDS